MAMIRHKRTVFGFMACGKANPKKTYPLAKSDRAVTCKNCLKRMAFVASLRR